MAPLSPTFATTRFGRVWPGWVLRLEASGRANAWGHTVTYPSFVGLAAVTLSTTAVASLGTAPPADGATVSVRVSPWLKRPPISGPVSNHPTMSAIVLVRPV